MRYLSTVTLAGKRDSRCLVRVLTRIIVVVEPSYQMNMLFRDFIILWLGEGSTSILLKDNSANFSGEEKKDNGAFRGVYFLWYAKKLSVKSRTRNPSRPWIVRSLMLEFRARWVQISYFIGATLLGITEGIKRWTRSRCKRSSSFTIPFNNCLQTFSRF